MTPETLPHLKRSNNRFVIIYLATVCLLALYFPSGRLCAEEKESKVIKQAVVDFFYCFKQKKYEVAYKSLAQSLQYDIPFYKFALKARDIKKADIKSVKIYDVDKYLAKMEITVKMELIYDNKLCRAVYQGSCDVVKEKGKWKLTAVRLKSKSADVLEDFNLVKGE